MNNKIPPPIVTLISGLIIFFSKSLFPEYNSNLINVFSTIFLFLGLLVFFLAVASFKKYKTTVNPLQPSNASHLVISGIFRFTRNPMYLGMALILLSLSLKFNLLGGLIVTALFIMFITKFQIIPEEDAMLSLFRDEFETYKENTRRWI
jgi:protein-S-isoprenylcysteine O-methyltransferase Ste14|tara:strand:+ start:993 stop:1439 length:447 start_codon:yes stop_codon:yes gene_type:complete